MEVVEKFWRKLEEQTETILAKHSAEVHAVAQALLERNDLTGRECIEVIKSPASSAGNEGPDSEKLLKALVEETIVTSNGSKNGNKNGKAERKTKAKPKTKTKAVVGAD